MPHSWRLERYCAYFIKCGRRKEPHLCVEDYSHYSGTSDENRNSPVLVFYVCKGQILLQCASVNMCVYVMCACFKKQPFRVAVPQSPYVVQNAAYITSRVAAVEKYCLQFFRLPCWMCCHVLLYVACCVNLKPCLSFCYATIVFIDEIEARYGVLEANRMWLQDLILIELAESLPIVPPKLGFLVTSSM